jgi:phage regulator Rha-like protein
MQEIIKIEKINGTTVIDSRIVAQGLEIEHKHLLETIRKYQNELESLGVLPFETAKPSKNTKGGRPETFCYLNEIQCNFVVTLSRNTEAVVKFKLALVKAFDQAKKIIQELQGFENEFVSKKRAFYRKQGYSDAWIEKRLESIEIRNELEAEWRKRGVTEAKQFSVLTGIISKETFGITPAEHKKVKGLKSQNLRDNMTRAELIFTMMGEEATIQLTQNEDAQGFAENKQTAQKGGKIAGDALKQYEIATNSQVVSALNVLPENRPKYFKTSDE